MSRRRKYNPRGFAHIYQRGYQMSVLFYYMLLQADSHETVSCFMREQETTYSREFNMDICSKGHVFKPVYGLSNKIGDKKKRDASAYLYNNSVEKGLSFRAEDYRWIFLAYALSDHPFSNKLVFRKASTNMKKVLAEVKYLYDSGRYVTYTFLKRWFAMLNHDEINQLADHIIVNYKVVDYKEAIRLYGSYEKIVVAINSNTGCEHDIHEDYSDTSDKHCNTVDRYL